MAKVVVVGGGLGGLAVAVRLAHAGHNVQVFEQRQQLGGRIGTLHREGYRFDTGPTLLMMLEPLQRLFADAGKRTDDYLSLVRLKPSYRVFFGDGTTFDTSPIASEMVQQIEKYGEREVAGYLRLRSELSQLYQAVIPAFVEKNYRHIGDLLSPKQIALLLRHRLLTSGSRRIKQYVHHPHLQMLFTFQSLYLGLSPLKAPWVYSILTHLETNQGIWFPEDGIYKLVEAIVNLGSEFGVKYEAGVQVKRVIIEGGKARAVQLADKGIVAADWVILNTDVPQVYHQLLPETRFSGRQWRNSCSALMFYIGYQSDLPSLLHHNVHFCTNFEDNVRAIFDHKQVPLDPSFYSCVSRRTCSGDAPVGCENLYLLVPVPNLSGEDASEQKDRILQGLLTRLQQDVRLDRNKIQFVESFTPRDWESMGLWQGAAFGLAHDFFQSTLFRPSNRTPFPNVYLVGASTIPGNGIPMVLISAELTAQRMLQELES